MGTIQLSCDCGSVEGHLTEVSQTSGNRIVCYCKDCQAFAKFLEKDKEILDENGGSDIYQSPQAHIKITRGHEFIGRMRLSKKGLNRWYTTCCKNPIGNTMGAGSPFVGVLTHMMRNDLSAMRDLDGYVFFDSAKGELPEHVRKTGFSWAKIMRVIGLILKWKIKGLNKPSVFFGQDGAPIVDATIYDQSDAD